VVKLPHNLTSGETFLFSLDDLSGASSVSVRLGGPETRTVTATLSGGVWTASVDTKDWKPGVYEVAVWTVNNGATVVLLKTRLTIVADASTSATSHDPRTNAEKIVEAIDARLAGNNDPTWASYTINGRSITQITPSELIKLRSYYLQIAVRERRRANGLSELGPTIAMRF
jgi:hypothetical protein